VGSDQQVSTLLRRDPASHVALDGSPGVAVMLDSLRKAGADQHVTTLIERLPAAGMFDRFHKYNGARFGYGREIDGRPANSWSWDDLT
jgi:hypothetical protein